MRSTLEFETTSTRPSIPNQTNQTFQTKQNISNLNYRVSHKKVYLFKTSITQAPNIAQKKFGTRNESMDILFQKHKIRIF